MLIKNWMKILWILLSLCFATSSRAEIDNDGLGQTIQIYTRFHSFVGKPSWLLIIRDLDNAQNTPHVFDISRGDNFWVIFTYGRNYLITVSDMQITTFKSRYNDYANFKLHDFCHLESNGRIIHGESLYITIDGNLSPDPGSITCHVSRFADTNFSVASPSSSE